MSDRGLEWLRPLVYGSLSQRDDELTELMDAADCDPAMLTRTYQQFDVINTLFSGWPATYRRYLRPLLSTTKRLRILDIGSGGGDLPLAIARWAARDGLRVEVVGADPDERAQRFAETRERPRNVRFVSAFSSDLVAAGESFDVVISNHLLHHLDGHGFGALLADSEQLAPRAVHADITRGRLAYAGFGMFTWPFFPGSFIRTDGLASIRRSHRPEELAPALPSGWWVEPQGPLRYLLLRNSDA